MTVLAESRGAYELLTGGMGVCMVGGPNSPCSQGSDMTRDASASALFPDIDPAYLPNSIYSADVTKVGAPGIINNPPVWGTRTPNSPGGSSAMGEIGKKGTDPKNSFVDFSDQRTLMYLAITLIGLYIVIKKAR